MGYSKKSNVLWKVNLSIDFPSVNMAFNPAPVAADFRRPTSAYTSDFGLQTSNSRHSALRTSDFRLLTFNLRLPILLLFMFSLTQSFSQTLDEYLQIAVKNNPTLKASHSEYLAATEEIPQAGALPDPELTVGFFTEPMERYMGVQKADISLMQMFPWFGMTGARKEEARKMSLMKHAAYEDVRNQIVYNVKTTWYALYQLKEEIRITEENLEILRTYERMALLRFQNGSSSGGSDMPAEKAMSNAGSSSESVMSGMSSGMATQNQSRGNNQNTSSMSSGSSSMSSGKSGLTEVLQIRLEIKELENRLASLKDSLFPLTAKFNQLLNRKYDTPVDIADTLVAKTLSVDTSVLLDSIEQNNPMLKMLEAEGEAYQAQEKMARIEGKPMLGVGVNYMPFDSRLEHGEPMGGKDMVMPMVSVTIPIYRKKYNAMRRAATFNQQAVQERKQDATNELTVQWASALRDLHDAERRITLYKSQHELTQQTLNVLLTAYASEGNDFEEVLRTRQRLLNYQLSLINATVDQHNAIAALNSLGANINE